MEYFSDLVGLVAADDGTDDTAIGEEGVLNTQSDSTLSPTSGWSLDEGVGAGVGAGMTNGPGRK